MPLTNQMTGVQLLRTWDLDIQPSNPRRLYSSHCDDSQSLIEIARWLQELRQLSDEAFEAMYAAPQTRLASMDEESLSEFQRLIARRAIISKQTQLIKRIERYREWLRKPYSSIKFSPTVEAFRNQEMPIQSYGDCVVALRALRKHWQSDEFRKLRNSHIRRVKKAHQSLVTWTDELLNEYPQLQVVHLFLASTPKNQANNDEAFTFLKKQRKELIKRLRKGDNVFTGTVGYFCKIFYHPKAGPRLVTVFFFDPSQQQDSADQLATRIGELWIEDITKGAGMALSQSKYRETDRQNNTGLTTPEGSQLGLINRDDQRQVDLLESLLDYIQAVGASGHYFPQDEKRAPRSQGRGNGPWRSKNSYSA